VSKNIDILGTGPVRDRRRDEARSAQEDTDKKGAARPEAMASRQARAPVQGTA